MTWRAVRCGCATVTRYAPLWASASANRTTCDADPDMARLQQQLLHLARQLVGMSNMRDACGCRANGLMHSVLYLEQRRPMVRAPVAPLRLG